MKRQTEERYEQEKIEKLIQYLRLYSEKGQPVEYEILVDNFKAVRRTNDPENFLMFKNFVNEDTSVIQVLLFSGSSNNNEKRIFHYGEFASKSESRINSNSLREVSNKHKNQNPQFVSLQEENLILKKQICELQKKTEILEMRQLWLRIILKM